MAIFSHILLFINKNTMNYRNHLYLSYRVKIKCNYNDIVILLLYPIG